MATVLKGCPARQKIHLAGAEDKTVLLIKCLILYSDPDFGAAFYEAESWSGPGHCLLADPGPPTPALEQDWLSTPTFP